MLKIPLTGAMAPALPSVPSVTTAPPRRVCTNPRHHSTVDARRISRPRNMPASLSAATRVRQHACQSRYRAFMLGASLRKERLVELTRRQVLSASVGAAAAALAHAPLTAFGFAEPEGGVQVIPFLDPQPADPKRPMLNWEH